MTEREAFDTTKYSHEDGLINDLASLAIESSVDLPLEKRVNPFVLEVANDGRVISSALGPKDVVEYYSNTSKLDRAEKEAGIKIRDCLLSEPDGTLSIWISPPGGPLEYEEGRIVRRYFISNLFFALSRARHESLPPVKRTAASFILLIYYFQVFLIGEIIFSRYSEFCTSIKSQ